MTSTFEITRTQNELLIRCIKCGWTATSYPASSSIGRKLDDHIVECNQPDSAVFVG